MKNKVKVAVTVVAILSLVGTSAFAYGPEGGERSGRDHKKGQRFIEELNLTPEQSQQLKEQRQSQKEAKQKIRGELKVKMQALHEAIAQPKVDYAAVQSEVAEINTLKGQLFAQHIDGVLSMKKVLTPEQFAQMQEHRKERGDKHGGDKGKHRGEKGEHPSQ